MSNRLTFSLASLVLILMFAFVAMPVMAHEDATGGSATTPRLHTHPLADDLDAQTDAEATPNDLGISVDRHYGHPTIKSVKLKSGTRARAEDSMAMITADDTSTSAVAENGLTLIVTFDQKVNTADGDALTVTAADVLTAADDLEVTVRNALGAVVDEVAIILTATVTRSGTGGDAFEVPVTFATAAIPNGTAKDPLEYLTFYVQVNSTVAYGLAMPAGIDPNIPGGANYEQATASEFKLVKELGDPPTPTTGTEGKITGEANLENPFPITITFAKAVDLSAYVGEETDIIAVTGGGSVVPNSLYDASPDNKPMTVWKVTVAPFSAAAQSFGFITITLKTTATVKPAATDMGGELTVRADGTLVSIAVPDDATDAALFVATLTFAESLADTVSVMPEDLKVTPADDATTANVNEGAKIGAITPKAGTDRKVWEAEITPVKGMATKVELSEMGKVKFGGSTASATVKVPGGTPDGVPSIDSVDATYAAATATAVAKTTITETEMLAANGFAVIGAGALPDLQRFFAEGGSISVLSKLTGAEATSVVISEIMWGLNLRSIGAARTAHQFIELYNTTGAAIDLTDITLTFDGANTPPAAPANMVLLDQASNVDGVGWLIGDAPGQSGRIAVPDDVTTFVPLDLKSMYRKIDYAKVEKTHDAADAAANRTAQLKDFPTGNAIGSWGESNAADTYGVNLIGSPGAKHFVPYTALTPTEVLRDKFIINEIGNHSNDAYDWVEIKRVGGDGNLKTWRLSQVTDDKKDTKLVSFPDSDDPKIEIAADGDVLLIVNSDPYQNPNHPLAAGIGINGAAKDRAETTGVTSRYYVDSGLKLANSGKTLLILRNSIDDAHLGKFNNIQDVVGTLSIVDNAAGFRTKLWPLVATGAPHGDVLNDDAPAEDEDFTPGHVYVRTGDKNGTGEHSFNSVGYTGIGYKRSAANSFQHGGTPGYPNNSRIDTDAGLTTGLVSISEIMYAKDRNLPQWIELYNSSMTQAVNLNEWKLKIEHSRNVDDIDIRSLLTTNNLGGNITIQPNQTVLIVSNTTGRTSRASQGTIDFPASRVINLWGQKDKLEVATGKTRLTYRLLSQTAFRLTLLDKSGASVDVAGNLGADGTAMWELPMADEVEGRSSIIRRYDDGVPRDGTMPAWSGRGSIAAQGLKTGVGQAAWVLASESPLAQVRFNETYYGSPDDMGTPGYLAGGPLPVSLSKFRPERLDDGTIVVRWITESELNNAGFNILRSETRNGDFTQMNTSLIKGQGTTSERTTYSFPDTSAKPNVVYYYQIQDVSLDGKVTTLRQSRLKGHISAAGKLTTTWGELKALQ